MASITIQTWRDTLPVDMLISAVLPSSEVAEGLMNYPAFTGFNLRLDRQQVVKEWIDI
jgi:hypothetical protein